MLGRQEIINAISTCLVRAGGILTGRSRWYLGRTLWKEFGESFAFGPIEEWFSTLGAIASWD